MTKVTKARGYKQMFTEFNKGYPGYYRKIVRESDGATMWAGPFVDDNPEVHPDWLALPPEERRSIMTDLE